MLAVLILYEHTITFREEIEFIWHRKRSWITLIFVANRYGATAYGILAIASSYVGGIEVRDALMLILIKLKRD